MRPGITVLLGNAGPGVAAVSRLGHLGQIAVGIVDRRALTRNAGDLVLLIGSARLRCALGRQGQRARLSPGGPE